MQVRLKRISYEAESINSYELVNPAGHELPPFTAGAHIDLHLANGMIRSYSLVNDQSERHRYVIAVNNDAAGRGGSKHVHETLRAGQVIEISRPRNNFALHEDAGHSVLIAGGIGITPFRSIVFRAAKEKLPHRIFLFYSNRRPEDAPFLDELQALERENPNYKLIASMTEMSKSQRPWQGEVGLIDKEMLARHLKDAVSPVYYVAGPPEMVKGLTTMIREAGVDDDDIRAEEFAGY